MSKETLATLNSDTLIGYTEKRGTAWHYRKGLQGDESNHYPGPIPVEDVRRRLFDWEAVEGPIETTVLLPEGVTRVTDPTRKAIIHPKTLAFLGVFKNGYQGHGYNEWLIENVENLLDSYLAVGSAGLLRGGAQAWVQIEMEDTLKVSGVEFRPFLTAATSMDGTLASQYIQGAQVVRCDNSLAFAIGSADTKIKRKHTRKSLDKIGEVRDALGIVFETGDTLSAEIDRLTNETVTDAQLERFLKEWAPEGKAPRSKTMATHKRLMARNLWENDDRVFPWKNTAFGVLQMTNTYSHHLSIVRNVSRQERNMANLISGKRAAEDNETMRILADVLAK
jgi:phage/plasmid-like protein (TIGR03299 family)